MNIFLLIGIAVAVSLGFIFLLLVKKKKKAATQLQTPPPQPAVAAPKAETLSDKLVRTRGVFHRLDKFWNRKETSLLETQAWQQIEETLLEADVGFKTTRSLLERVKERLKAKEEAEDLKSLVREELEKFLIPSKPPTTSQKPYVISIVGINGVGKTTTIGKLAHRFKGEGKSVLLGGADTFRAGAVAQLKIWSDRVGVPFVGGKEGGDPGAVAFDALSAAVARNIDIVLIDTAGRLHTKTNLMDELKKVHRVMKKVIPTAPHETWLVLDGTLGQNSLVQAKEFSKALELSGVIVTKLDGTAKGGALLAVSQELNLPVRYIGLGESLEDLIPFEPKAYLDAIL